MSDSFIEKFYYKFNYQKAYFLGYIISAIIGILSVSYIFGLTESDNVSKISAENVQKNFQERSAVIEEFLHPYKSSIKALHNNIGFIKYVNKEVPKEHIESLFLTIKDSLPYLTQVRYIDLNGKEIIRIEGKTLATDLHDSDTPSLIVQDDKLQNKSKRDYVQQFMSLSSNSIGISNMELNMEHGKVEIPKTPVVRLGMKVLNSSGETKGILVYNICLTHLFEELVNTTLYDIHLVDKYGRFILNNQNNHGGIVGPNYLTYTLEHDYGKDEAQKILNLNTYMGDSFFSSKLDGFKEQNIIMVLDLKYDAVSKHNSNIQRNYILGLIAIALLLSPFIYWLSKVPQILQSKVTKETYKDSITDLPNRRKMFKDLDKGSFKNCMVIIIHIGNYIKLQNIYGFDIGNELMIQCTKYLKKCHDVDSACLYKYGHDSYALKYNYNTIGELHSFIKKLHYKLEHKTFVLMDDIEVQLDVTLGVSDPRNLNNNIDELKEAEIALEYALKQNLEFTIYDHEHLFGLEVNKENLNIAKHIKNSIDSDGIELHYQPIYNNEQNKIEKYETLIRLKTENGVWSPNIFLDLSKEIKKYRKLTNIMIEKSFKFFADKSYEFSINISAEDVFDKDFKKYFFSKVDEYKVADRLVVEIVESESIKDYEHFYEFVKSVKKAGAKVAIDDFGSGYSNFEHLIALSEYIDYLKIDGSLITNVLTDNRSKILVESIQRFCTELGIKTIAEYVENEELINYLSSIGVNYSQGFYIGKPEKELKTEMTYKGNKPVNSTKQPAFKNIG